MRDSSLRRSTALTTAAIRAGPGPGSRNNSVNTARTCGTVTAGVFFQRPGQELRSSQVTAFQLSEEDGALLLGASAAHDLAAVPGLLLLLGRLGILVTE